MKRLSAAVFVVLLVLSIGDLVPMGSAHTSLTRSGGTTPGPTLITPPPVNVCALLGKPTMTSTSPAANTITVGSTNISATFTTNMNAATSNSFVVIGNQTGQRSGLYSGAGSATLTLDPGIDLRRGEQVEFTLAAAVSSTTNKPLCVPRVVRFRAATANTGANNGTFFPSVNYNPNGLGPRSVTSGDFNGDGNLDLAVANQDINKVTFMYGQGGGTFTCVQGFGTCFFPSWVTGSQPVWITTGDFNNDGKLDVATSNRSTDNVSVLLNTGNSPTGYAYFNTSSFAASFSPDFIAAGDLNADGKTDLVTSSYAAKKLAVLINGGNGTFGAPSLYGTGESPQIALGDFNGDGRLDVAATDPDTDKILVWVGKGDGSLTAKGGFAADTNVWAIATADVNNDAKLDLVTANHGVAPKNVSVYLGDGNGTFTLLSHLAIGGFQTSDAIDLLDLNGDGALDVVVADRSKQIAVLLGNGTGSFGPGAVFATSANQAQPFSITSGDFNSDGDIDLATANYPENNSGVAGSISVLSNQP